MFQFFSIVVILFCVRQCVQAFPRLHRRDVWGHRHSPSRHRPGLANVVIVRFGLFVRGLFPRENGDFWLLGIEIWGFLQPS